MTAVVDWARVYDYGRDEALEQRLQIWLDIQRREKREVTKRRFGGAEFIFSRDGEMDDITNQSGPPPGVLYLATEPEVIEPDQEPEDDTTAEVPDVREDTVNDD